MPTPLAQPLFPQPTISIPSRLQLELAPNPSLHPALALKTPLVRPLQRMVARALGIRRERARWRPRSADRRGSRDASWSSAVGERTTKERPRRMSGARRVPVYSCGCGRRGVAVYGITPQSETCWWEGGDPFVNRLRAWKRWVEKGRLSTRSAELYIILGVYTVRKRIEHFPPHSSPFVTKFSHENHLPTGLPLHFRDFASALSSKNQQVTLHHLASLFRVACFPNASNPFLPKLKLSYL